MTKRRRIGAVLALSLACACRVEAPHETAPAPAAPATATTPPPAVVPSSPVAPEVVADLGRLLALDVEGATLDEWPGREAATCHEVTFGWSPVSYTEMWCTECTLVSGDWKGSFRFFPDVVKGACTLQEVRAELAGGPPTAIDAVQEALARGRGMPAAVEEPDTPEPGSFSWSSIRRWSWGSDLVYLYLEPKAPGAPRAVSYLRRSSPLLWLQREDAEPVAAPLDTSWGEIARRACRDAGLTDCDAAHAALVGHDARTVLTAVQAALDRRDEAGPGSAQGDAATYWLDVLAADGALLAQAEDGALERLAGRGLTYEPGYDSIALQPNGLRELAERRAASPWGQRAVVKLMGRFDGEGDDDPFRAVIARGERFLREHPGSAVERDVVAELAAAHETWWSLSKSVSADESPEDLARWRQGADGARRRALELYRRLKPRDERERARIEQRVFRLERDIDTGCRAHAPSTC